MRIAYKGPTRRMRRVTWDDNFPVLSPLLSPTVLASQFPTTAKWRYFLYVDMCVQHAQSLSHIQLIPIPWTTVVYQAPLSMEFSRQEYWSGLPFPVLGIFLTQGLNLCLLNLLPWQADSIQTYPLYFSELKLL